MMIDVGVDAERFAPPDDKRNDGRCTLLFAGRLEARKGAVLLLRAFERLSRHHPDLELRIVGDGPQRPRLEALAETSAGAGRVTFVGLVDHAAMQQEFERADVFVFPSLRDTSGAVVLEAMAMALPVVTFDHQGAALMVSDACGIKVPAGNVEGALHGLEVAIAQLASNPQLRKTMGQAARQHVEEQHDWSIKTARICELYESISRKDHSPCLD
jgi:glycosyltransferase involved in cell wall biosynthesis